MASLMDLQLDFDDENQEPIYAEVRTRRSQGNVMHVHVPPVKVTNSYPTPLHTPSAAMNPGFARGYNDTLGVWSGGLKSRLDGERRTKRKHIPRLMRSRDNGFLTLPVGLDPRSMLYSGHGTLSGPPSVRAESLPPGPPSSMIYSLPQGPPAMLPMGYRTMPLQRPFALPPPGLMLPPMDPQARLIPIGPTGKRVDRHRRRRRQGRSGRVVLPDGRVNPCFLALLMLITVLIAAAIIASVMLMELGG